MGLTGVPDVGEHFDAVVSSAGTRPERNYDLGAHLLEATAEFGRSLLHHDRARQVVTGRAQQETKGREDSGVGRHQHGGHIEAAGQTGGVEAAGPAERQEWSLPGIGALFDRDFANRLFHQGVDHLQHARGDGPCG